MYKCKIYEKAMSFDFNTANDALFMSEYKSRQYLQHLLSAGKCVYTQLANITIN